MAYKTAEDRWKADMKKAVNDIGRCLDGFQVFEAELILERVRVMFIHPLKIQGPKD